MKIGLKEAISALREELSDAILSSANEDLRFEVGEILMEFQVEIEQAQGVSGEINIWVVNVGGGATKSTTRTHTISIPLKPVTTTGHPILTGGVIIPD